MQESDRAKEEAKARLRQKYAGYESPGMETPERGSPVRGFAESIGQGALFGFGDELLGGVGGALAEGAAAAIRPGDQGFSFGDSYRSNRDDMRGRIDQYREDHPWLSLGGEILGGIATGGALAKGGKAALGAAASRGGRLGGAGARVSSALEGASTGKKIMAAGTAGGALYGAGEADENDRAVGAVTGAVTAGVAGAALPAAGRVVGKAVGGLADAVAPGLRNSLAGRAALARNTREVAQDNVREAITRDGSSPRALQNRLSGLTPDGQPLPSSSVIREGEPMSLLEIGGENVRGRGRLVGTAPGPARQRMTDFLTDRQSGQHARVVSILRDGMETGSTGSLARFDEIIAQRADDAAPLYDDAFGRTPIIDDEEVITLFTSQRPAIQRGVAKAREIAANEGRDLSRALKNGNVTSRDLHYLKLGLDDALSEAANPLGGGSRSTTTHQLRTVRNRVRGLLSDLVPGYDEAASEFAGASRMAEALEDGASALKPGTTLEEVQRTVSGLGDSEREAYVLGALNDYIEKLSNKRSTQGIADDFGGKNRPAIVEKFRALAREGIDIEGIIESLARESETTFSRNEVLTGSRTAPLLAEGADNALFNIAGQVGRGDGIGALASIVKGVIRHARGNTDVVNDEVAKILTATGQQMTDEVQALIDREVRQQLMGYRAGLGAFAAGGALGG